MPGLSQSEVIADDTFAASLHSQLANPCRVQYCETGEETEDGQMTHYGSKKGVNNGLSCEALAAPLSPPLASGRAALPVSFIAPSHE